MAVTMKTSEVNHLRRLLAWVRCEIGQSPDELMDTIKKIAPAIGEPNDFAKDALVKMHDDSYRAPQYIRDALKMLAPLVRDAEGNIVDAELKKSELPRTMITEAYPPSQ